MDEQNLSRRQIIGGVVATAGAAGLASLGTRGAQAAEMTQPAGPAFPDQGPHQAPPITDVSTTTPPE
jgi:hypothetical protein